MQRKEECLRNAQRCRAKAHLVLLQSKLLSSDIRVITLSDAEVKKLLNEHKHFHEVNICQRCQRGIIKDASCFILESYYCAGI